MAILGNIIKGVIDASEAFTTQTDHHLAQQRILVHLLERAADTAFGLEYGFRELLNSADLPGNFAKRIPYFDYPRMHKFWWKRQLNGEANVSWPGKSPYFALSSGTTGTESKRIPVTADMLNAIRQVGVRQLLSLRNFDLPADFFEKEILMLGSSTALQEKDGHLEGEISGISAGNIPFWFRNYYKPGKEIAGITDWDEKVAHISRQAADWDIGALSGIPSWIELMLEEVIYEHRLKHIHEIWPNLQVYTSGGVAFGPYRKSFNALMGKPVEVLDTYLASEGFLAYQSRPGTESMRLSTDTGVYFEFVPFEPEYILKDGSLRQDAPSLNIKEVTVNTDYVLLISTVAGAWRYLIGDTIQFTDVSRAEIRITGRTKFFLNTVGSQLSVNKMDDAVQHLESEFSITIPEYTLCAKRFKDGYYHSWYLGTEDTPSAEALGKALDVFLKGANKNYEGARAKALKGVKLACVKPAVFYEWNARHKKKGGQVKMERVMSEEKFRKWEKFANLQG